MCCVKMTPTVVITICGTKWSRYRPNLAYNTHRRIKMQQKMFHREIPCLCQKVSIEVDYLTSFRSLLTIKKVQKTH